MAKETKSEAAVKIEKAAKEKKAGPAKPKKNGNVFKRFGKWWKKFWKDFKGDLKKITWPGGKTVFKSTIVVIVAIAIVGAAVFLVDLGLSKGLDGLRGVADNYQNKTSASETVSEKDAAGTDTAKASEGTTEKTTEAESTTQPSTQASSQASAAATSAAAAQ